MLDLSYTPEKIVDTATISHEEWLDYRRKGIGGSDAAVIFSASKWKSRRELYYDKIGFSIDEEPKNWFSLDSGNAMEIVLRKAFEKKTGYKVIKDTWQYRHPLFPFMLADADFFCFDNKGKKCGGEIKTTDVNNLDQWYEGVVGEDGRVPIAYEFQARHYMAVFNLDCWYFICCYGFSEDKTIIVRLDRDLDIEETIIEEEYSFWNDNIIARNPPIELTISDESVKKLRRLISPSGTTRKSKAAIKLNSTFRSVAEEFMDKYKKMKALNKEAEAIKGELNALSIPFTEALADHEKAAIYIPGNEEEAYEVSFARQYRTSIKTDILSSKYPEIFKEVASSTESRPFSITKKRKKTVDKLFVI